MQLYAWQGERALALRVYHTCVTLLQRELGVEPHPATQDIYARLLNVPVAPDGLAVAMPRPVTRTTLVGRQSEWTLLRRAWRMASQGTPHLVLIAGEAGIGKSRLAAELWHWVQQQGLLTAYTCSYAAEGDLAFAPIIEWLAARHYSQRCARWMRSG